MGKGMICEEDKRVINDIRARSCQISVRILVSYRRYNEDAAEGYTITYYTLSSISAPRGGIQQYIIPSSLCALHFIPLPWYVDIKPPFSVRCNG